MEQLISKRAILKGVMLAGAMLPVAAHAQATHVRAFDVAFANINEWLAIRTALVAMSAQNTDLVVQIDALSTNGAVVTIRHSGPDVALDTTLTAAGFQIGAVSRQTNRASLSKV